METIVSPQRLGRPLPNTTPGLLPPGCDTKKNQEANSKRLPGDPRIMMGAPHGFMGDVEYTNIMAYKAQNGLGCHAIKMMQFAAGQKTFTHSNLATIICIVLKTSKKWRINRVALSLCGFMEVMRTGKNGKMQSTPVSSIVRRRR
jgi:hypothetical protein